MTWVEEYDRPGQAIWGLLLALPQTLLRQFFDVVVGIILVGVTLVIAQVALGAIPIVETNVFGDLLAWLASIVFTEGFLFFATVALVIWTYLLVTVVAAEGWDEFTSEEEMNEALKGDATGFEREFRRVANKFVVALYKAFVVLLAGGLATVALNAGYGPIAPVFITAVPLAELWLPRRGYTSPATLLMVVFLLVFSAIPFSIALVTYTIRRTPDAAQHALDSIHDVILMSLDVHPESESLLDDVLSSNLSRSPKNR